MVMTDMQYFTWTTNCSFMQLAYSLPVTGDLSQNLHRVSFLLPSLISFLSSFLVVFYTHAKSSISIF